MKAIAYIRVSTTNQEILRQTVKVQNFCSVQNMEIVEEITDFGISGGTMDRVGLQKLLNVTKDNADVVVVSELARLSRNEDILETLHSVHILVKKGFKLIFLDDPHKVYEGILNIEEIIILSVRAKAAADERIAIVTRNIEGKKALFASNPYAMVDGSIPHGFKKTENPAGKHPKYILTVDDKDSKLIVKIFDLINNGYSLAQVRNYLHDIDVKTKNGDFFTTQGLSKIYRNPIYKGDRTRDGVIAHIKPIIEPEKWESAQFKIKENHMFISSGTTMFNPLKGILKCRCGRAMMVKSKGNGLYVYRCSETKPAYFSNRCEYHDSIRYHLTNEVIFSLLKKIDFVEYTEKIEDKIADLELQCGGLQNQIVDDGKRIHAINAEIPTLQERYVNAKSQLLADAVQDQLLKNEMEIKQINSRIEKNTNKIARLKDQIKNIKAFAKSEDFNNLNLAERASLFKKYIKRIQYLPVTIMQGFYDIEFKFGVSEKVAVKKTNKSPIFAIVPQAFELTEELKLRVTTYDPALAKERFDFGAMTNQEITIQQFFDKFADEYLTVDLSYRDN